MNHFLHVMVVFRIVKQIPDFSVKQEVKTINVR